MKPISIKIAEIYVPQALRKPVDPGMQLVERLAIAALIRLDTLHQAPEQALDRLLIHGTGAGRRDAVTARRAHLPTWFRNHPVPLASRSRRFASEWPWEPVRERREEA